MDKRKVSLVDEAMCELVVGHCQIPLGSKNGLTLYLMNFHLIFFSAPANEFLQYY